MLTEQKYLKRNGTVALITVMSMFVPLSIDMYLPALPDMTQYFHTTEGLVNFTLAGFFFFFAVGLMIFGPLSDKYGRRRTLIAGCMLYVLSSCGCAVAGSIYVLILFRILQAFGAGSMISISTALIKDCFDGSVRQNVLAIVQGMSVFAPMLAPLIGAQILRFFTWRATFWTLVIAGGLCLLASLLLQETLTDEEKTEGGVLQSMQRLVVVGRNRSFMYYLLIVALASAPYMAYISVCSYIYIDYFGISQQTYSFYFAFNSAFAVLGPVVYLAGIKRMSASKMTTALIILAALAGAAMILFGTISPLVFMLTFLPFTLAEAAIRPLSTNILLDQQDRDTGSASSLINFVHTVLGSAGMFLGTMPWPVFIIGLAVIILAFTIGSLVAWAALLRSRWKPNGL